MQTFFSRIFPLIIIHIRGDSMSPAFHDGERVFALRFFYIFFSPAVDDVVIAADPRDGKFLIKRITAINTTGVFLSGDNPVHSTDSRSFGMIVRSALIAKVISKI